MTSSARLTWPTVAFLALVIGALLALVLTNHSTTDLVTLLGLLGVGGVLGVHNEVRSQQASDQLAKISHNTNGVLTARIETAARKASDEAVREVLRQLGHAIPYDTAGAQPAADTTTT